MRVISRKKLKEFWQNHADAEVPLKTWFSDAKSAAWKTPMDIKATYRNASFVANNRVIFNIKGNKYRLVVSVNYDYEVVYIRFIGTHSEYDKIDASTV